MSGIRLKLLGQFECLLEDGTPLNLQTRKAEVLLAFLALEPGIRHPRERLINLLWSDRSEEQARNSLRQSLSAIKKPLAALKTMPLDIDRTTVLLDADLVQVDALEFEQLAAKFGSEHLSAAASLYTGEFLEGITIRDNASQDWLTYQRDRYKRLVVETLTQLSTKQITQQNFAAAIESGETLVDYDPFTESGWRNLMQAYHANDQRNHALLAYKRCWDFLRKELEVEPEAETTLLKDSIRSGTFEPNAQAITPAPTEIKPEVKQPPLQPDTTQANATLANAILVMPFENLSNDTEQQYFSEGITEGIIVGLSTYPSLTVLSRHYSFALLEQKSSIREMSEKYGVRYVVEGSVRKTPQNLRITAQLVDTENGEQIWGKRFDSAQDQIFEIEDELTRTIVANIKGKMDVTDEDIAYQKPAKDMSSYDLLMKGKYHLAKFNPTDNQLGREALIECIERDSECELAFNYLYRVNILDWLSGWTNPRDRAFEEARTAIERAIALGENESIIQASYAEFLLFDRAYEHCTDRAERAYRINPNDTETLATLSAVHAGLGNIDLGLEMADTCRTLDPFHPWIDWVNGIAYYAGKRYQDALDTFKMMANPPDEIDGWLAICNERLGRHTAAEKYLQQYVDTVRQNMPHPPQTVEDWHKLWQSISAAKHDYGSDYPFNVLCVAGLEQYIEITEGSDHGEKLPAVVVLPFDNLSGDPQQEYFSDGITESIIYNLSLFPQMQVKSRNSSFAFKEQLKSVGEISRALDVDYIVEGSIRKSPDRVRVTIQLVETKSGNQVWGKRYDTHLEDIFELEDELSRTVAATVTGRIESELQQIALSKSTQDLRSYDLLLIGIHQHNKFTPLSIERSIENLNQCLTHDPTNFRAHAYLFESHIVNWTEYWTEVPEESFRLAGYHAEKALKLAPHDSAATCAYAEWKLLSRDYEACKAIIDKALKETPNHPKTLVSASFLQDMLGNSDKAVQYAEHSMALDPYDPWGKVVHAESLLQASRYIEAIEAIKEIMQEDNNPYFVRAILIYCHIKLGNMEAAKLEMKSFLAIASAQMKAYPNTEKDWFQYWRNNMPFKDEELIKGYFNLLLEAGLCDESNNPIETNENEVGEKMPAVVVLPFDNLSGDVNQEYFSDGITESIIDNLSLFPDMSVKSRNASFAYKQQIKSAGEISKELGVDYIVEGSIRKSNSRVRVTVQLVDADNGNQVWSQRFDSDLKDIFDLEEELSRTIAANVTGRISSDLQQISIAKNVEDLHSYDLLLQGLYYGQRYTAEDVNIAIEKLYQCLDHDTENFKAHAALSSFQLMNWLERWSTDIEESFQLAGKHVLKALSIAPNSDIAQAAYAEYLTFDRQYETARTIIDKMLQTNPSDPEAFSQKALLCNMTGKYEDAIEFGSKCMELDPHHPWGHWQLVEGLSNLKRYDEALAVAAQANTSPPYLMALLTICYSQSGQIEKSRNAIKEFLISARSSMKSFPKSRDDWKRYWHNNMPFENIDLAQAQFEILVQAGLCEDIDEKAASDKLSAYPTIAVLPFSNLSNDSEQQYFSDGISESIIRGLSMYKGLVVKSSQSSFAYRENNDAIHDIAEKMQVKYIVDGSVRKVGNRIRLAAQLIDSETGNQLWGKHYDADLDDVLALEEEMSQIITGTIRGRIDSDIQQTAIKSPAQSPQSYDLYLRGIYHVQRYTPEDQTLGKQYLNQCIKLDPENALAHAHIAAGYHADLEDNLCLNRDETLKQAKLHIEKALQLDPDNAFVHGFMSEHYGFARDFDQAEFHADKAIELNPTLPDGYCFKAWVLGSTRRLDESMQYADKCLSLDPHHPYVGWVVGESYRNSGLFEKAIETYRSLPYTPLSVHLQIAICLAGVGKLGQAKVEMAKYHQRAKTDMPNYPQSEQGWIDYTHAIFAFQFEEDAKRFYELAVVAGLLDFIDKEAVEPPSIAVLPFQNLSNDPEQEQFASGITGDIVNILSKFRHLRTVSSYSTALYKDRSTPMSQIAAEQNVRYLLDGGIRKSGEKIRINAQLIDSTTNENIWSEQYNRDLDDMFSIQDEITMKVASAMKVTLLDGERSSEFSIDSVSIKAWECCVLASDLSDSYIKNNISKARALTLQAIELEPNFTYAWSMLAWTYWQEAYAGWSEDVEKSLDEAQTAMEKSLHYNADNWDGLIVKGFIHLMRDQPELAIETCNKAADLAPGVFDAVILAGFPLNYAGEYELALEAYESSLLLCPVAPNWACILGGFSYQKTGQVSKAIQAYKEGIDIEPDSPVCRYYLMDLLIDIGENKQAQQVANDIHALTNPMRIEGLVRTYSHDKKERNRFKNNLTKMGFN